ncbi:SLATT domain-containing protein [Mesorhizobium microcysteis]|uniref:SLATT domain-containing protein n=1 Tax=Neoaquamicrobium microcysteis TaxID=2682781 RepID=A0A5D4H0A3_9HYPH|nr:SLATT domain-containing protein [Mesorhizobium microcysteis]TYR33673.1 SLATT domain-containing protein [Mesorhizobium microcysteis]
MSEPASPTDYIQDKIWITSRVRMIGERRLLRYNVWSLFLLAYYSVFTVILSVFSEYFKSFYTHFDGIAVAASVAVLVASLVVGGFRFERTASLYRDCYLSLQRLYDDEGDVRSKQKLYADILVVCPNHSNGDYHDFLFTHIILEGKEVTSNGKPLHCTWYMKFAYVWRRVVFWTLVGMLILIPLAFAAGPFAAKCA